MNDTSLPDNPRERIGDNYPPEPIDEVETSATDSKAPAPLTPLDRAETAYTAASGAAADLPVVQTEDEAKALKVHYDVLKGHEVELDALRDAQVRPLNERVSEINGQYKPVIGRLKTLRSVIADRLGAFAAAEEALREKELAAALQRAEEAKQAALAAEAREREAIENADAGECTDVGGAIAEADDAFHAAKIAEREALRAERDVTVRIGGGVGRALGLRTTEELTVDDPIKVLKALLKLSGGKLDEKIEAAILTAARAYRKAKGELPAGVTSSKTRGM